MRLTCPPPLYPRFGGETYVCDPYCYVGLLSNHHRISLVAWLLIWSTKGEEVSHTECRGFALISPLGNGSYSKEKDNIANSITFRIDTGLRFKYQIGWRWKRIIRIAGIGRLKNSQWNQPVFTYKRAWGRPLWSFDWKGKVLERLQHLRGYWN